MLSSIIANLHNVTTDRYHPILFAASPLPGGKGPARHKSAGHHSEGFDTREDALEECRRMAEERGGKLCIAKDFAWDGEEVPAMVVFFFESGSGGELEPALF